MYSINGGSYMPSMLENSVNIVSFCLSFIIKFFSFFLLILIIFKFFESKNLLTNTYLFYFKKNLNHPILNINDVNWCYIIAMYGGFCAILIRIFFINFEIVSGLIFLILFFQWCCVFSWIINRQNFLLINAQVCDEFFPIFLKNKELIQSSLIELQKTSNLIYNALNKEFTINGFLWFLYYKISFLIRKLDFYFIKNIDSSPLLYAQLKKTISFQQWILIFFNSLSILTLSFLIYNLTSEIAYVNNVNLNSSAGLMLPFLFIKKKPSNTLCFLQKRSMFQSPQDPNDVNKPTFSQFIPKGQDPMKCKISQPSYIPEIPMLTNGFDITKLGNFYSAAKNALKKYATWLS